MFNLQKQKLIEDYVKALVYLDIPKVRIHKFLSDLSDICESASVPSPFAEVIDVLEQRMPGHIIDAQQSIQACAECLEKLPHLLQQMKEQLTAEEDINKHKVYTILIAAEIQKFATMLTALVKFEQEKLA